MPEGHRCLQTSVLAHDFYRVRDVAQRHGLTLSEFVRAGINTMLDESGDELLAAVAKRGRPRGSVRGNHE
jgi:hypothetical protein